VPMSNHNFKTESHGLCDTNPYSPPIEIPGLIWFYGLWISLAMLSTIFEHSTISSSAVLFLLGGITSTNFFFLAVAHTELKTEGLARLLANYQTIMGIAWISAYLYFSNGSGELVLGMYMTVLMFAVFHLDTRTLLKLGLATLGSYALIMGIKFGSAPATVMPLQDGVRFLILMAITGWIYMFARRLRDLRLELQFRNEELQNVVVRITRIAEEDHLTKSYNRRYIMDILARERSRSDRSGNCFSLLLFDLDHFKRINDRYGHVVGDQILSDFAGSVKKELRGMDSINTTEHKRSFGRYGGEEFIAVLPGTDLLGAHRCAERIREVIASQNFRDRYAVTTSVGVAEYQRGETVPQLLTRADQALYKAKRDGRNLVRCSERPMEKHSGTKPNLRILK
jgi:diguanylate cyclase (GGDEF)-like protein